MHNRNQLFDMVNRQMQAITLGGNQENEMTCKKHASAYLHIQINVSF